MDSLNEAIYVFGLVVTYITVITVIDIKPPYDRMVEKINWLLILLIFLRLLYFIKKADLVE